MSAAIIFLARHGSHDELGNVLSGRSDIGLSQEGEAECRRLAQRCASKGVTTIQASPRRRARHTAEIVAAHLGLPCREAVSLDEIDFGDWTGRRFTDLDGEADWRHWNAARHLASPPGGETMGAATARIVDHLEALAAEGRSHVLCVSHCDMIRGAVAHYLGLGLDRLLRFAIDPGSLTTLEISGNEGRVLALNEMSR